MDAFEALGQLAKLGKKIKEVQLGDLKIELGTLNAEQEGNVFVTCADLTGNAYFNRLKLETLKYSIKAVNGSRLDDYEKLSEDAKREKLKIETLDKLQKILGSWDENVISFLYSKWSELSKEAEDELKSQGFITE
jgi:hypothetical protein